MREFVIDERTTGQRLDRLTGKLLGGAGHGLVQKLVRKGVVKLNGKRARGAEIVRVGDVVRIFLSEERIVGLEAKQRAIHSEAGGLDIVYEDADILVVNKPVGVLSQPSGPGPQGSLVERAALYMHDRGETHHRPAAANRLDRNTSGLVVMGKHPAALARLGRDFRSRAVSKTYIALVVGEVREAFAVEGYISRDESANVSSISKEGKAVSASFAPIAHRDGMSLVRCMLETGRSHQLRASLAHKGVPILGDPKYGIIPLNERFGQKHQLLHCYMLEFADGQRYRAEPPWAFAEAIERIFGVVEL